MWGFPCCALLWSCWGFVMAAALCSSGARRTPSSRAGLAVAGTVLISSTALPSSDLRSAAMYGNREGACTLLQKRAQSTEGEEQTLARSLQWVGKLSCNVWQRGQKEQGLTLCWLSSPQSSTQQCLPRKWLCYSHSKTEALMLWLLWLSSCLLMGCFPKGIIHKSRQKLWKWQQNEQSCIFQDECW